MSSELTKEAELVLKYTGILDRDTIMTYDIQVELFNLINEVQAIPQSQPSPKGTEEIADDAIKQIRSFNYPPKDFQLKAIILQALQSKQGWSEEDMIQAYIKGGLACIFNDGDMMQSPAYPEWLTQYKREKGIV